MKIQYWAALAFLAIAGCAREADTAHHTVEEYRADKPLRQEIFQKCINDPGTLMNTPDCINAREAERLESLGSLRESGPIGLDQKKRP